MTNVVPLTSPTAAAPAAPKQIDWDAEYFNFVTDVFANIDYFPDLSLNWDFPHGMDEPEWMQRTIADATLMDSQPRLAAALFPLKRLFLLDQQSPTIAYYLDDKNHWHSTSTARVQDLVFSWLTNIGEMSWRIDGIPQRQTQLHMKVQTAMGHLKAPAGLPGGWASTRDRFDRIKRSHPFSAFQCGTIVLHDGRRTTAETKPEDYILASDVLPVSYDPAAVAPESFDRFMQLLFSKRAERQIDPTTYRRRLWLAAFPAMGLQPPSPALQIIRGPGNDGKTFLFSTIIKKLVGKTSFALMGANTLSTVGSANNNAGNYDIASFVGKKVVVADDSQSATIGDTILKQLVAGSEAPQDMKARAIYGAPGESLVTWSFVMLTNGLPKVDVTEHALERRLFLWEIEGVDKPQRGEVSHLKADSAAAYLDALPLAERRAWIEDPQQLMGLWNYFCDVIVGFQRSDMDEANQFAKAQLGINVLDQYLLMMFEKGQYTHTKYINIAKARNVVRGALKHAFGGGKRAFSDTDVDQHLQRLGIPTATVRNNGKTMTLLTRHLEGPLADRFAAYGRDDRERAALEQAIETFGVEQDHRAAFDTLMRCHRSSSLANVADQLVGFTSRYPTVLTMPLNDIAALIRIEQINPKTGAEFVNSRLREDAIAPSVELLVFVRDELRKAHALKYKNWSKDKRPKDDTISNQIATLDNILEKA